MTKRSTKTDRVTVGVIGGSGLYEMEGLTNVRAVRVATPFGRPSDEYRIGTLFGRRIAFLPRHGRGHRLMPTDINYRANIYGMKKLGVERIISVSAVGSMREDIRPGDIVIPHQFYDHTKHRRSTFFGNGVVAHVGMADALQALEVAFVIGTRKQGQQPLLMLGPQPGQLNRIFWRFCSHCRRRPRD